MKIRFISILFVLFGSLSSFSQVSQGGKPFPLSREDMSRIPVIRLVCDEPVEPVLKKEHSSRFKSSGGTLICEVNKKITEAGISFVRDDGTKIWRVGLYAKDARSVSIFFDKYALAPGVKVFVYDPSQEKILGAFTHKNNKSFGKLAISPVFSNTVYVEMQMDKSVTDYGELEIGYVAVGTEGKKSEEMKKDGYFGVSDYCNVDINCIANSDIQKQKYSVVRIFYSGEERCTGTLLNNTRENGHPYLITANHCISDQIDANGAIFFFNYESPVCEGGDGSVELSVSGANLVATTSCVTIGRETECDLDFSLLELSENPPFYYHAYFSGWDRRDVAPQISYSIHHPWGDVKKIAFEDHPVITADYGDGFDQNTFWLVRHWELGTTERGSSGAGLFDGENRLVGTLTGGDAYCGNSVNDYFQKFYHSWEDYPEIHRQLKFWLDPLETHAEYLNGFDPYKYFWQSGDTLTNIPLSEETGSVPFAGGYLSGHNSELVNRFAEHFITATEKKLIAVYLNVDAAEAGTDSSGIILHIFSGGETPGEIIFSKEIFLADLTPGEINLVPLDTVVAVGKDFYIGYEIFYGNNDVFSVNMTSGKQEINTAFVLFNNEWTGIDSFLPAFGPASFDIRPVVFDTIPKYNFKKLENKEIELKPNPAETYVNVRFWEMPETDVTVEIFNLAGQRVYTEKLRRPDINIRLNIENFNPGMYVINFNINNFNIQRKLLVF